MDIGNQELAIASSLAKNKTRSWNMTQEAINAQEDLGLDSTDEEMEKISATFIYNALNYDESTPTQEETIQRVTKNRSIYSSFLRRANTAARTSFKSFAQKRPQRKHKQADDEHFSIEENTEMEKIGEQPDDVSHELAAKLMTAMDNFIGSKVKGLDGLTIEKYLEMMKTNFPVESEDWQDLETKMRTLCKQGPKVRIKCDRGKIVGYKKYENIKLVAFFKPHNDFADVPLDIVEGVSKGNTDDDLEFNFDKSLLVPGFSNSVLRIEVRKIKTQGISKRLLVGYAEMNLVDIPSQDYFESYHALYPSDKGSVAEGLVEGVRRISVHAAECPGYLNLSLIQDKSQVHANQTVPKVLTEYFWQKAKQIFEINHNMEIEPNKTEEKATYRVYVNQNMSSEADKMEPWQKLVTVEGNSRKVKDQSVSFPVECLLTDQIELGTETRKQRSLSPSTPTYSLEATSSPSTMMRSLSPSINNLMSPKKATSFSNLSLSGSTSSLSDLASSSMKGIRKLTPKKIVNNLVKATENINISETFSLDRGTSKAVHFSTCLPVGMVKPQTIQGITNVSWTLEIKLQSTKPITTEEYQLLMVRAILKKLDTINPEIWDGSFINSVSPIFKIIDASTDGSYLNRKLIKAKSFMMAHSFQRFNNVILYPHIQTIVETLENSNDEDTFNFKDIYIDSYQDYAVDVLSDYRKPDGDKKLQKEVLKNIRMLLQIDPTLEEKAKKPVSQQVSKLFKVWKEGEIGKNSNLTCQYELCTRMLVLHVIPDLYLNKHPELKENSGYQDAFKGIFNYQDFLADLYIDECKAIIKDPILDEERYYNEDDPIIQTHLAAYNCFSSFRKVLEYSKNNDQSWLYQMFDKYAKIWINMALSKANIHLDNLIHIIQEQEKNCSGVFDGPSLSRESSMMDDSAQGILYQFNGISETVWIFWKQLEWPNIIDNFRNGSNLILGLSELEGKIINEYHKIHMQDTVYDSKELSNDIEVLVGIKKKQRRKVDVITDLHTQLANGDLTEVDMNTCKIEIERCHGAIEDSENKIKELIETRIKLFCQKSIEPQIKKFVQEKNIESSGDCLLQFMDQEFKKLSYNMRRLEAAFTQRSFGVLWDAMEQEILTNFKQKKERNIQKNKPERFNHIKYSMNSLIEMKNDLYNAGKIMCEGEKCFKTLREVKEDVLVLSGTPEYLIKMVLRKKTQEQKVDFEESLLRTTEKSAGQIKMKIGYNKETGKILVELKSLHDVKIREGKKDSKIKIQVRFYPDRLGKDVQYESPTYKDVIGSIAFDMEEDKAPLIYNFGVNHTISGTPVQKQMQDIFVTVTVLNCTKKVTCIGEVVVQLIKNGVLMPELPELNSKAEFTAEVSALTYHLHNFSSVYHTSEYHQLSKRNDSISTSFVSREKSLSINNIIGP